MMTTATRLSLLVLFVGCALPLRAQDSLKSVDLGTALKTFVESVQQATATEAASLAKQRAAERAVTNLQARITATNSTAEQKFSAHAQGLEVTTDAALAHLAAVRRSTSLLATAREALAGVRRSLNASPASEAAAPLPSPAEEQATDATLDSFTFAEGEVDQELVEANQAAKEFYNLAMRNGSAGASVNDGLTKAERELRSLQARTMRRLVLAEAALSHLEIQAAQGLGAVATHTLTANALELSFERLPFLPLPQVAAPGAASSSIATGKVPTKSAFTR